MARLRIEPRSSNDKMIHMISPLYVRVDETGYFLNSHSYFLRDLRLLHRCGNIVLDYDPTYSRVAQGLARVFATSARSLSFICHMTVE